MQTALTYWTNRDQFSNYLNEYLPGIKIWDEFDGSPRISKVGMIVWTILEVGNEIINRVPRSVESMRRPESLSIVGDKDGY